MLKENVISITRPLYADLLFNEDVSNEGKYIGFARISDFPMVGEVQMSRVESLHSKSERYGDQWMNEMIICGRDLRDISTLVINCCELFMIYVYEGKPFIFGLEFDNSTPIRKLDLRSYKQGHPNVDEVVIDFEAMNPFKFGV